MKTALATFLVILMTIGALGYDEKYKGTVSEGGLKAVFISKNDVGQSKNGKLVVGRQVKYVRGYETKPGEHVKILYEYGGMSLDLNGCKLSPKQVSREVFSGDKEYLVVDHEFDSQTTSKR